jgi:hypothetical protein
MILFYLRALRDLRGESSVSSWVAALPRWAFVVKKFLVDGCSTVIKLAQAAE